MMIRFDGIKNVFVVKYSKYLYKFVNFLQHTGTKLQVFLTINNFYRQIFPQSIKYTVFYSDILQSSY